LKRGLLTPKKAPQKQTNPEKTENEEERIKRGGGKWLSGQALKRNEKGKKNRPNIPTPST